MLYEDIFIRCLLPHINSGGDIRAMSQVCKIWRRWIRSYLQMDLNNIIELQLGLLEDIYDSIFIWPCLQKRIKDFLELRFSIGIPFGGVKKIAYSPYGSIDEDECKQNLYDLRHVAVTIKILSKTRDGYQWNPYDPEHTDNELRIKAGCLSLLINIYGSIKACTYNCVDFDVGCVVLIGKAALELHGSPWFICPQRRSYGGQISIDIKPVLRELFNRFARHHKVIA